MKKPMVLATSLAKTASASPGFWNWTMYMSSPRRARTAERSASLAVGRPSKKMRSSIAKAAAFEPTDRNAVIGVGEPS